MAIVRDRVPLVGPGADDCRAVESAIEDLRFAKRALREMGSRKVAPLEVQPIEDVDTVLIALWHGAASAYARCFNQGVRMTFSRKLVPTDPDLLQAHREVIRMRREHISHYERGTSHERVDAFAEIGETENGELALRVSVDGRKTLLPSAQEVRRYRALVDDVLGRAETLQATGFEHLAETLRSRGGAEILRAAAAQTPIRVDAWDKD
jgi:hypothetical protein